MSPGNHMEQKPRGSGASFPNRRFDPEPTNPQMAIDFPGEGAVSPDQVAPTRLEMIPDYRKKFDALEYLSDPEKSLPEIRGDSRLVYPHEDDASSAVAVLNKRAGFPLFSYERSPYAPFTCRIVSKTPHQVAEYCADLIAFLNQNGAKAA